MQQCLIERTFTSTVLLPTLIVKLQLQVRLYPVYIESFLPGQ